MKKFYFSLMLVTFCSSAYSLTIPASVPNKGLPIKATEVYIPVGNTGQLISVMELSQISVKDLEKLTGKKMKFIEKVNLKLAQRQLKKNINDDGSFSKKFERFFSHAGLLTGISWLGLALGVFLSLIGVLIAYLLSGENKGATIKWAWIGFVISLIIWGAVLI